MATKEIMCALPSLHRQSSSVSISKLVKQDRSRTPSFVIIITILVLWKFSFADVTIYAGDANYLMADASHLKNLRSMLESNVSARQSPEPPKQQRLLKASELPDATGWTATKETPYEVCFVTSVYSTSPETSDRPPDITEIKKANPSFQFFAFTNMEDIDAPGWTIKIKRLSEYRRYITQSRWAKFMGWKDESVQGCQAVFYMDGFCGPKLKHSERYKRLAMAIHDSEFGLFQNQHEVAKGPIDELERILERNKDIAKNVDASKAWLEAQPDFRPDALMYANHYLGYNPKNAIFQQAAEFFWARYSLEKDSWRDQPLWSYVLDHFDIVPTRLGTFDALFKEYYRRMGHAGHKYNASADNNAATYQEKIRL